MDTRGTATAGTDLTAITAALPTQPGVPDLDHLHVWDIDSSLPTLSAHVLVAADAGRVTLQVDHVRDRHRRLVHQPRTEEAR